MKKILVFSIIVVIVFALCGCGAQGFEGKLSDALKNTHNEIIPEETSSETPEEKPARQTDEKQKEETKEKQSESPKENPSEESEAPTSLNITVMSYNMRCNVNNSFQDNWVNRRESLIERIRLADPDIIGTQELKIDQKKWVMKKLAKDYTCVGIARDTKGDVESGEGSYIFFRTSKFELLETKTKWLSETPDVCSYGWDAACRRVVTFARLRDKASGIAFVHYNVHLDHKGKNAILNGNNYVLSLIESKTIPVVYTGDLNHTESHKNYQNTTKLLKDSKYAAESSTGGKTYTAYNIYYVEHPDEGQAIDHCFVSNSIDVHSYKVDNVLIDGMFGSDHFPIIINMTINKEATI